MAECGPDCEQTLREIEAYLDGEVDDLQAAAVQAHLSDCHPCMDRAEFRTHLKALIHDRCTEDEPAGLRDKILAAIEGPATITPPEA
jgi:mycothiol system anti-sigma-R factor